MSNILLDDLIVRLMKSSTGFYRTVVASNEIGFGFSQDKINPFLIVDVHIKNPKLIERLDFASFNTSNENFIDILHEIMELTQRVEISEADSEVNQMVEELTGEKVFDLSYSSNDNNIEVVISTASEEDYRRILKYDR